MRKMPYLTMGSVLVCLTSIAVAAQESSPGYLPGAPRGRLFLTIELKGSGRKDLSNKVEWYRLTARRKLDLELAMVIPTKSLSPTVKVGGIDKDNAPMPPGMAAMAKALEPCQGDEECQRKAMIAFGRQVMADPQAFGSMKPDDTRFENWVADRHGPCAKGILFVEDEGEGMNISPPAPAKPYRFKRTGRLDLPSQGMEIMARVCQAEISVDRQTSLLSLRLNRLDIPVPVQMAGQAFTSERSVLFLEGRNKLELFDQPIDPTASTWTGQGRFEKAGTVSHNFGQTLAPMTAELTWRFVRN